jgi:uncharacterized protein (TIGR00255 family)
MAVFSMTGYAGRQLDLNGPSAAEGAEARSSNCKIGMEIRSVNSRFLDMVFRLPDEWRTVEPALRERLQVHLKRGKVELRLWREEDKGQAAAMPPTATLQRVSRLQDQMLAWFPNAQPLGVADLMRLVDSTQAKSPAPVQELLALVDDVLVALKDSRAQEGARMVAMLRERCAGLRALALQAQPLVQAAVAQHQARFIDRWNEALAAGEAVTQTTLNAETKAERALTEAAAFALRVDVAEELTRLNSHVDEIERLLKKGGELGKRLDFLIQELHREANTLSAKSQSIELTRVGVDMRVMIEQMREQVQNIE